MFYKTIIILTLFLGIAAMANAQQGNSELALSDVIAMAKRQSIAYQQASTLKEIKHWEWKTHLSNYKPQLLFSGTLPDFVRTFQQVIQPNGSIDFQSVSNNNSSVNFSLNQSLIATGGTLFASTNLQRFDDFDRDRKQYNGAPIAIGYRQPIFGFNELKWNRKINPLRYEESQRGYVESMEQIALNASDLFFDLLLAQANLQIAQSNLTNNDTIYKIAEERFDLGQLSRNDLLQLKLEVLKSKKALISAQQNLEVTMLQLSSYIGYRSDEPIALALPSTVPAIEIDNQVALQQAYANRSDALAFRRRKLEAERDVVRAKRENGLKVDLFASFGFSNTAGTLGGIYQNPQDQESLQLAFEIPILDWGRAQGRRETALANKRLIEQEVEQDQLDFEKRIFTLVSLYKMLKTAMQFSEEADHIAAERYRIAKDRYILGDMSITNLSIALQEKDQAKRDYIASLRDFWNTYFDIRAQTLFDFERGVRLKNY